MTLRLDEATSQQLRDLSKATGRSQQQLVHQAVHELLARSAKVIKQKQEQLKELIHLGNFSPPLQLTDEKTLSDWTDPPLASPQRDAQYQAMIDAGFIHPAKEPFQADCGLRLPSPPGGILAYLDREDRF